MKDKITEEYVVEFTISGKNINEDKLKKTLSEIGHSLEITKGEGAECKVYIRSSDPRKVFDRSSRFGKPTHIKVNEST